MSEAPQDPQASDPDPHTREFLLIQFQALRAEVLGKIERVVRIQLVGVTAIPLVIGAGEKYGIPSVLAAAPFITIIFALILLYEQNSIMRVGRYIRRQLEPQLVAKPFLGWEEWLETYPVNRRPEYFFAYAAYIAFSIYYLGGSYLAYRAIDADPSYSQNIAISLVAAYLGGFLLALYVVITNFAVSNRSQEEPMTAGAARMP